MKMYILLFFLLCNISNSFAYEKWEEVGSFENTTFYLDEGGISKINENEYSITIRQQFKKPQIISVDQTKYRNGVSKTTKGKRRVFGEENSALLDTARGKIYIQKSHYIGEKENIALPVSPSDVINYDSFIYKGIVKVIKEKFKLQEKLINDEPVTNIRELDDKPKPVVREQHSVLVNGQEELWFLEWLGATRNVCGPESEEWTTCPCGGFAFGESGKLVLLRKKDGKQDESLLLSNFPGERPSNEGEATLRRWDLSDKDYGNSGIPEFASQVYKRPLSKAMNLGDYDHDGNATEFVFQVGTEPCGKRVSVLIGVSHDNGTLHAFGTVEHPERPLELYAPHWDSLKKSNGTVEVIETQCGDHGSETERTIELKADHKGLHATRKEYSCPEGKKQKKRLLKKEIL